MLGPLGLTLGLFAAWWLIGLAPLAALRVDTRDLRLALIAPALGTCVATLPGFVASRLGVALDDAALPLALGLGAASAAILAWRRPPVHAGALAVVGICLAGV